MSYCPRSGLSDHSGESSGSMRLLLLWCTLRHAFADAGAPTRRPLGPKRLIFWRSNELHFEVPSDWAFNGPVGTVCVAGDDRAGNSEKGLWNSARHISAWT
eukprot:Skav215230  [mRNA]  locus=scaffold341:290688:292956:- [translate_table: standard]